MISNMFILLILFVTSIFSLSISIKVPFSLRQQSQKCPVMLPPPQLMQGIQPRIIGGFPPDVYVRSHIVSFYSHGCGGALLSSRWVITAAHCSISTSSVAHVAGSGFQNGQIIEIEKVYNHPSFAFPKNDISLIKLKKDVPKECHFVKLNANPGAPALNEYVRVIGYGSTDELKANQRDGILRQVDLPIVDTNVCKKAYQSVHSDLAPGIANPFHLCAGYDKGGCDGCYADSGGPLILYHPDGSLIQVGIVSFGFGCARASMPGGYTRITNYLNWIQSIGVPFKSVTNRIPVFPPKTTTSTSNPSSSSQPQPVNAAASVGPIIPNSQPISLPNTSNGSIGPVPIQTAPTSVTDNINTSQVNLNDEDSTLEEFAQPSSEEFSVSGSSDENPVNANGKVGIEGKDHDSGAVIGITLCGFAVIAIGAFAIFVWIRFKRSRSSSEITPGTTTSTAISSQANV